MMGACTPRGSGFSNALPRPALYGREYSADGLRAGVPYRKQAWYDALDFACNMSVPNVAHLDPQPVGCCTVMPYFIGNILELPVTSTRAYTLFNILKEHSTEL
jgi:hypothetical protein